GEGAGRRSALRMGGFYRLDAGSKCASPFWGEGAGRRSALRMGVGRLHSMISLVAAVGNICISCDEPGAVIMSRRVL
ncbi:MAG: hypothetical protein V3V29_04540, partial [Acidimicrobiia bacterium]